MHWQEGGNAVVGGHLVGGVCSVQRKRGIATGRHGHNELDDPQATLPLTYARIQAHPRVLDIYADRLQQGGLIPPTLLDSLKVSPRTTFFSMFYRWSPSLCHPESRRTALAIPSTMCSCQHQYDRRKLGCPTCSKQLRLLSAMSGKAPAGGFKERQHLSDCNQVLARQVGDRGPGTYKAVCLADRRKCRQRTRRSLLRTRLASTGSSLATGLPHPGRATRCRSPPLRTSTLLYLQLLLRPAAYVLFCPAHLVSAQETETFLQPC